MRLDDDIAQLLDPSLAATANTVTIVDQLADAACLSEEMRWRRSRPRRYRTSFRLVRGPSWLAHGMGPAARGGDTRTDLVETRTADRRRQHP